MGITMNSGGVTVITDNSREPTDVTSMALAAHFLDLIISDRFRSKRVVGMGMVGTQNSNSDNFILWESFINFVKLGRDCNNRNTPRGG